MYRRKFRVDRRDFVDRNSRPQMEVEVSSRTKHRIATDDNPATKIWDENENFNAVREYQLLAISFQLTARFIPLLSAFCLCMDSLLAKTATAFR